MPEYQNRPATVDAVTIKEDKILLIKRGREPFLGYYALPGGFVEIDEDTKTAALRELLEETGVVGKIIKLVGVFDDPGRDPTRHTLNISYLVEVLDESGIRSGDDANEVMWFDLDSLPPLAFDHGKQVSDALRLIKG
jgi:8-oxo-dGTP diphosphatase